MLINRYDNKCDYCPFNNMINKVLTFFFLYFLVTCKFVSYKLKFLLAAMFQYFMSYFTKFGSSEFTKSIMIPSTICQISSKSLKSFVEISPKTIR